MSAPGLKGILERRLRSSPNYKIVLYDRLSADQKAALPGLQNSPLLFGILAPRIAAHGVKSISRDAALLFYALSEPGPLPSFARDLFGGRANESIARLVLDGILEIEVDDAFVSGPSAQAHLYELPVVSGGKGVIARLSVDALRYGETLQGLTPHELAMRLYSFNRLPLSPQWLRQFPSNESIEDFLDAQQNGTAGRWLRTAWLVPPSVANDVEWRHYKNRFDSSSPPLGYKLFVSPHAEAIGECFAAFVQVASECQVPWFKVGRTLMNILRPDKIVAYFPSFDRLEKTAAQLRKALDGILAQGVPFTAELSNDGLLSWGMDPPRSTQMLSSQHSTSWRLWVSQRLAMALHSALSTSCEEPWQFALQRLQLEGVDPETFTPIQTIWDATMATSSG